MTTPVAIGSMAPMAQRLARQRGFTFLEFAFTIMILGVLFLMTLKGREIIPYFRAFVTVQQIRQYQSDVAQYQSDYHNTLPGDDPTAAGRWSVAPALNLSGGIVANFQGDGKIDGELDDARDASGEQYMAWRDLRLGGYVEGDSALVGQSARPENKTGEVYGFAADNLGLQQVLCVTRVPGRDAEQIDKKLDDGNIATGRLRGTSKWDPAGAHNHFTAPDSTPYDPEKTYIICLPYLP